MGKVIEEVIPFMVVMGLSKEDRKARKRRLEKKKRMEKRMEKRRLRAPQTRGLDSRSLAGNRSEPWARPQNSSIAAAVKVAFSNIS